MNDDNFITGIFEYDRTTQRLYLHPDENSDGQFFHLDVQMGDNSSHEWVGYDDKPMEVIPSIRLTADQKRLGEVVIVNPMTDTMPPVEAIALAEAKGRRIASQVLMDKQSKEIESFAGIIAV